MTAAAAHAQSERCAELLGGRAEPPRTPIELDAVAGTFVDAEVGADCFGMRLAEPLRAEACADLLVGRGGEDQLAGRLESLSRQRRNRDCLRRDLSLHVERASTPHLAVAKVQLGRIRVHDLQPVPT